MTNLPDTLAAEPLVAYETMDLDGLQVLVANGRRSEFDTLCGYLALYRIHRERLYEPAFTSWAAYYSDYLDMSKTQANRWVKAGEAIATDLGERPSKADLLARGRAAIPPGTTDGRKPAGGDGSPRPTPEPDPEPPASGHVGEGPPDPTATESNGRAIGDAIMKDEASAPKTRPAPKPEKTGTDAEKDGESARALRGLFLWIAGANHAEVGALMTKAQISTFNKMAATVNESYTETHPPRKPRTRSMAEPPPTVPPKVTRDVTGASLARTTVTPRPKPTKSDRPTRAKAAKA